MAQRLLPGLLACVTFLASASCASTDGPPTDDATGGSTTDDNPGTGGSTSGGQAALGGSGGSVTSSHQVGPCTFEDEALAQDVREHLPYGDEANVLEMQVLSLGADVSSLEGIACLTALTDLSISGGQTVLDLTPVADLSMLSLLRLLGGRYEHLDILATLSLGHLQLSDLGWTSLDILEGADIVSLWIEHMPATDLSALATIASLRSLQIEATETMDLSPLAQVAALADLTLSAVPATELPALGQLNHLQWLFLRGTSITTLAGLAGAPELGIVDIDSAPELVSLAGLEGLPALYRLTIHDSALSDVSALSGSTSLGVVDLIHGAIEDISALGTCQSLQDIALSDNRIVDIEPLASLTPSFLWLDQNQIVDLEPLPGTYLYNLNISDNPVGSLDPVGTLQGVTSLFMQGVGATSLDFLADHELDELDASDNQIENVDVLLDMPLRLLDLRANSITALPDDFVGGTGDCSLTQLDENPLDAASKDQLEALCAGTDQDSYSWDGGNCGNCILIK